MQTEEQVEIEDLKNKDELIKDMIEKTFKLWGYH